MTAQRPTERSTRPNCPWVRDPSNTRGCLRMARGDGLLSWVTSHNFRKTVATALDVAGQSARQIAD
jgi:hypothetical protein